MPSKALTWLRRRPLVGIAGSAALHLVLVAALVWVKPPSSDLAMKRGEPLFVELPEANEEAQRGLPGGSPAAEPPKAAVAGKPAPPPSPPLAKAQPAPKAAAPRAAPPAPAREPRAPEPPKVASAPSVPKPEEPAPEPAAPAVPRPDSRAAAEAPKSPGASKPAAAARDTARKGAGASGVLAALGHGGAGGAGGRGVGRAGIEGEPIPLDSKDPKYDDYLDRVRRMIHRNWGYPCVRDSVTRECEDRSTQLVVEFGILKEDGRVPYVTVLERAHREIYDEWALNAIKLASPFPPVPLALMAAMKPGSTGLRIVAVFRYLDSSYRFLDGALNLHH